MTARKQTRLQQMGLGPVWVRRDAASISEVMDDSAALPAAPPEPLDHLSDRWVGAPVTVAAEMPSIMAAGAAPGDDIGTMDWDRLEASVRSCTRCGLCEGRTLAVPGTGDRRARWLFVGEGPGRNEDKQGEPFVGPAGKLLDNMLRALGLARGANTYIANIVKCRPVGADGRDRPPTPQEVAACLPYLQRQVALIRPDVIIALGKTAAVSLLGLGDDVPLASLRGKVRDYAGIPLVVTYHPAYLLRKPIDKAKTWRDLCAAKSLADGR